MPIAQTAGAKSGAHLPDFVTIAPDLRRILDAWPTLPEALKAGILAMVAAARKDG